MCEPDVVFDPPNCEGIRRDGADEVCILRRHGNRVVINLTTLPVEEMNIRVQKAARRTHSQGGITPNQCITSDTHLYERSDGISIDIKRIGLVSALLYTTNFAVCSPSTRGANLRVTVADPCPGTGGNAPRTNDAEIRLL